MAIDPARDLVDGVVTADVFGIADGRPLLAQHTAMDRTGLEIERGHGVDRVRHLVEPGGAQLRLGQRDAFHGFQEIAERRALRAARGLRALLQFLLEIGVMLGTHDHHLQVVVVFDLGDDVVIFQHVLIEQIAERQIFRIVADRHHGDDLLGVQIKRQRPLYRDIDLDGGPGLIGPGDAFGQPRIVRIGKDQRNGGLIDLHHGAQASMTLPVSRYKARKGKT
jgi:hypothetical protein